MTGLASASFAYDGVGRRQRKAVAGSTTDFLYDGVNPVQELVQGIPTANLLTGSNVDEYFLRTDTAGQHTLLTDALGSTVALSDSLGAVQTEYTYDPFGSVSATGVASTNSFTFTGRETDGTGLSFYRARYYDPRLQRFAGEDPLSFGAGDPNLHAYVGSSPANFTDPHGTVHPAFAACLIGAAWDAGLYAAANWGKSTGSWQGAGVAAARGCASGALGFGVWRAWAAWRAAANATALSRAGQALDRGGLTRAGRALAKHGGRNESVFPKPTGSPSAINQQGQAVLDDILGNVSTTSPNRFGGTDYFGGRAGGGARFDGQGNFIGFLEP